MWSLLIKVIVNKSQIQFGRGIQPLSENRYKTKASNINSRLYVGAEGFEPPTLCL